MAAKKRNSEQKANTTRHDLAPPRAPAADTPSSSPTVQHDALTRQEPEAILEEARQLLGEGSVDKNVLLNIPIWGWTGDGKTCALITAIHFSDPSQHPLGFALITDYGELTALEASTEEYKGLNLPAIAESTTQRLRELSELFIDKSEWPHGTDDPSAYVLAIRTVADTLGYVMFPDIRGGSFREVDETAREVLRRAHAAIVLVNPALYTKQTTDGKRYRDEILARLHQFSKTQVPVCVMITKGDLYQGADQATDSTHNQLTVLLERQVDLRVKLCRVSVIGLDKQLKDGNPPSVSDRNPAHLVAAYNWVVAAALSTPATDIRGMLPVVDLQIAGRAAPIKYEPIPELRFVGEYSNSPGVVLCATSSDSTQEFTFLSEGGELFSVQFDATNPVEPAFLSLGKLAEYDPEQRLVANFINGELMLGPKGLCNFLWLGPKGSTLARTPLPFEIVSWVPVTPRRLLAVDASGRLHSLLLSKGRWKQLDYVEAFVSESQQLVCAFSHISSHAFVYSTDASAAITLGPDGKFRERVQPTLMLPLSETSQTVTNREGLCATIDANNEVLISAPSTPITIGEAAERSPVALAASAGVVAFTAADGMPCAAVVKDGRARTTSSATTTEHSSVPNGLAWSDNGRVLVASFEDGTWAIYRSLALLA